MVNRYAQMDAEDKKVPPKPSSKKQNRYAQMDAPVAPRPAKPVPKAEYTWGDAGYDAISNTKQGVADALTGAGNLAYDTITDTGGTVGRVGKAAGSMVPAMVTTGMAMSPWAKALPKPAQKALNNLSPPIADLVGQYYAGYLDVEELKQRIGKHPIATAADLATIGTLPGIAHLGKAVAARLPSKVAGAANLTRYAAVPTHAINDAVGYVAKKVIPTVASRVVDAVKPTNAMITRNLEGRGKAVLNAMRNPKVIVPGSIPTTAQAASAANAPRIAAIAKAAEKRNPGQHLDTLNAQHQARVDHLRTIADPNELDNLHAKRTNDAIEGYTETDPAVIQTHQGIYDVLERPLNASVVGRAQTMADSVPRPFQGNYTPAVPEQRIPDPFGQNIPDTIIPAQAAKYPEWTGKDADTVKKAFDDLITKARTDTSGGLGPEAVSIMRDNRSEYLNLIHDLLPEYTATRAQFAATSKDIDRADLVKYLEERLQSPTLGENTIKPRADVFSNAVREAAGANPSINAATGEKRFNNLSDRFDPGQMGVVQNIQDDMGRAQLADAHGVLGDHYTPEIDAIFTKGVGLSPNNGIARMAMGPLNHYLGNRAVQGLSTTQGTAKMVENAMAMERMKELSGMGYAGVRNFLTYGNPARWANRYPGLYNAMNAQQQGQPQ